MNPGERILRRSEMSASTSTDGGFGQGSHACGGHWEHGEGRAFR